MMRKSPGSIPALFVAAALLTACGGDEGAPKTQGTTEHSGSASGGPVDGAGEAQAADDGVRQPGGGEAATANAEAMGMDLNERGRTVIEGLVFEPDSAALMETSGPALEAAASLIRSRPGKSFYVVGHSDTAGAYAHITELSSDRAAAVRASLVKDYGVDAARLQAVGLGPVAPITANSTTDGKARNRRVELVER